MKMSTRALVAAVSATIAFGFATPQVWAAPHSGHGHAAHATAHGKGSHGAKAAGTDHKLTNAQKKIAREAARKDRALERSVTDRRLSHLSAETADAVRANVAEDRTSLAALATGAAAATTAEDLSATATLVHAVRPEGYRIVVNRLGRAARLQAKIDAADPAVDTAAAQALVDSAVTKALAYRASDPRAALRAIQSDLNAAAAALAATDDTTDTPADPTDPAPTDPAPADPAPAP